MVEYWDGTLDRTFGALSDATRRHLLQSLAQGEHSISELAKPLPLSFEAVSKHLRVLESAGLVKRRCSGRTHYFSACHQPLRDVATVIEELSARWVQSLENLAVEVKETPSTPAGRKNQPQSTKAVGRKRR